VSETHGRIGLGLAAVAFFGAWLLMPGVGITDAERIFALVGAHRGQVMLSSVLQLFSAACYAPAAVALVVARPTLRVSAALLLVGAMGSAADAVFHLFAYEMTAPGAPREALLPVMARMQGPGLVWILPLIACFFVGTGLLARAAHRADGGRSGRRVAIGLAVVLALLFTLAFARQIAPGRAIGLALLAWAAASQIRVALSSLFEPVRVVAVHS
jgi:hypothetical protein